MPSGDLLDLPRTVAALEAGIAGGLHLGAQLCVWQDGEERGSGAVGENRSGEPLTPEHQMTWLSATKPVTAVALLQLWERGLLELDDPVARHIPEFAAQGKERITIRHLLIHTGGIRRLDLGWPERPWAEILATICAMRPEPRWPPGEKAGYHAVSSWFVLGELVQRLSGRPFPEYVRAEVFLPLGMDDCWIGMPEERYRSYRDAGRLGAMWYTEPRPPRDHGWDGELHCTRPQPGGNGNGPMRQLVRFYQALLGGGTLAGRRILSPQAVEAMAARHRAGIYDHTFKHVLDWGLGVIVNSNQYGADTVPYGYGHHASYRTYGHAGFRSSVGFADPEHRLAVSLVCNGTPTQEAHERRNRAVLDALYDDLGLAETSAGLESAQSRDAPIPAP
jgi:CubicO group peptidase (beta-lactamase class C family)